MFFPKQSVANSAHKYSAQLYLLIIIIIALFLRLYKLDFKSLWLDELYTIVPTNPSNTVNFVIDYCRSDQPPFFFVLIHYWFKIFTYTSYSGRLFSVVVGILGVVAMYFLGKEIKDKTVGLFASFFTCINYFHIYYSQELRFYSLLFFLTVISFLFFIKSLKYKKWYFYFLYGIATISMLYTQYYGLLIFVIQGFIFVWYVISYKEKISFIISGLFLGLIIALSFLPWLPTLLYDSQINDYWIPKPSPHFFLGYYRIYWGKDLVVGKIFILIGLVYLWNLIVSIKRNTLSKQEGFIAMILISWIFLSYLLPYLRSILATPMIIPRYTIVTLPAILIAVSCGMVLIKNKVYRAVLIVVITTAVSINLFLVQQHYINIDKAQWREAAQAVIANHKQGEKVYSNLEWWYNFYFYFTDPHISVTGKYALDEKDMQAFIHEFKGEKSFWVLNGEGLTGLNEQQQEFVKTHFREKKRYEYYAASAILYARR